jgi:hypothetical protein
MIFYQWVRESAFGSVRDSKPIFVIPLENKWYKKNGKSLHYVHFKLMDKHVQLNGLIADGTPVEKIEGGLFGSANRSLLDVLFTTDWSEN